MLKAHGVTANIEQISPTAPLEQVVKPYSILLINYATIAKYAQDTRFQGWHWLIYIGVDPADSTRSLTLDPDYWGNRMNEGDHKSYPTAALRAAFRPYSSGYATAITFPDLATDPLPVPPPFEAHEIVINVEADSWLNVRAGAGTGYAKVGAVHRGDRMRVVAEQYGWLRIEGAQERWISKLFASPAPAAPPVIIIPPPPSTTGGYGPHFLQDARLTTGKYKVYKSVDQDGLLEAAHNQNPDAMHIHRKFYEDAEQTRRLVEMQTIGIEAAYNRWYNENKAAIARFPYAYFESYNEVLSPDVFLMFETYRTKRLAEINRKACVLNIQPGHTDKGMWQRAKAMVDAVIQHNGIIGEHCYAQAVMSSNANDSYWIPGSGAWSGGDLYPKPLRPMDCHTGARIVQSKYHLANQGQSQAVIVATELGISDVSNNENKIPYALGIKTFGWKSCFEVWRRMGWINSITPEQFYLRQLDWWAETTGCLGVVFTHGVAKRADGTSMWDTFDTMGLLA
jgi:hypothetical protein